MNNNISINTGEAATSKGSGVLETSGIGSCLVIILFDEKTNVGGMAHAMLPSRKSVANEQNMNKSAKYVDEAIDILVDDINKLGGDINNLKARIIGGAKMFKILSVDNRGIGFNNIEAAKKKLREVGIMIDSEDTGGTVGRIVKLDIKNGLIEVVKRM